MAYQKWQRGEFQIAWYKEHLHKGKDSKVTTVGLQIAPPMLSRHIPNHTSRSGFSQQGRVVFLVGIQRGTDVTKLVILI